MRRTIFFIITVILLAMIVLPQPRPSTAQDFTPGAYRLEPIVTSGLTHPTFITPAGDGSGRLFITEQAGLIKILQNGAVLPTPFLDLTSQTILMEEYSEQGLLGLAFHPDYATNGYFYVHYTGTADFGNSFIVRYQVSATDPNSADPASAQILLEIEQPAVNHNGGTVAFGPDGYLYIGMGDGGPQGDLNNNGQNRNVLLGKILRIDVDNGDPYAIPADNPFADGVGGLPEIWAYGLRNPFRFSFDRATGDLYIGDVGEDAFEEVDFQPAASLGGENYGWKMYEANDIYRGPFWDAPSPNPFYDVNNVPQIADSSTVAPVAAYPHAEGCAVAGGYVYRGDAMPNLVGVYVYGDWCTGHIWWLKRMDDGTFSGGLLIEGTGLNISGFGQAENGDLYVVNHSGGIYQLVPAE